MRYQRPDVQSVPQEERHEILLNHFHMSPERLQSILQIFEDKLTQAVGPKKGDQIECIPTSINQLPTTKEQGECYALTISEEDICAQRIHLDRGQVRLGEITSAYFMHNGQMIDVRKPEFTATILLNAAVETIKEMVDSADKRTDHPVEFVMASSISLELSGFSSAFFRKFHEFCPCYNGDPVEGTDLIELFNIGLESRGVPAKIIGACSNATALLIAGSYERPKEMARCLMGIDIGSQVGAAFVQANPKEFGLDCSVLEMDIAHFHGKTSGTFDNNYSTQLCLPYCSVDFEVDYAANPKLVGTKSLQRMVALKFIPEICRRLIIQAFQNATPTPVWVPHSLPAKGALKILSDGPSHEITMEVLDRCWDWKPTREQVKLIHSLVRAAFSRSAAIVAIVIAAIAKRTGRLQPALGGVTSGMTGILATDKFYQNLIRGHLDTIFQRNTSDLIQFLDVDDSPAKGAAVLSHMIQHHNV